MEPFTMGNRMKSFLAGGLLFLVMLLFTGYAEAGVLGFNPGDLLEKQVLPIVEAQKAAENVADPDKTQDPRGGAQMNHAESGNNNAATGITNSLYASTLEMPVTGFVLGVRDINWGNLAELKVKLANLTRNTESKSTVNPGINFSNERATTNFAAAEPMVEGVKSRLGNLITGLPMVLLLMMFMAQVLTYVFTLLVKPEKAMRVSIFGELVRFVSFLILLALFKTWVSAIITFINSVIAYIAPDEQQRSMTFLITSFASTTGIEGGGLAEMFAYVFRIIGYMSIKILIILRDVLMALTILIGPYAIALGYLNTYDNGNPFSQYLIGWFNGFVKMNLWALFATIVIYAMALVCLMAGTGTLDALSIAIFGLASLKAAKNIPNMADEMSGMVLTSMLGMIGAWGSGAGMLAMSVPAAGGALAGSTLIAYSANKLREHAASSAKKDAMAKTMGSVKSVRSAGNPLGQVDSMGIPPAARQPTVQQPIEQSVVLPVSPKPASKITAGQAGDMNASIAVSASGVNFDALRTGTRTMTQSLQGFGERIETMSSLCTDVNDKNMLSRIGKDIKTSGEAFNDKFDKILTEPTTSREQKCAAFASLYNETGQKIQDQIRRVNERFNLDANSGDTVSGSEINSKVVSGHSAKFLNPLKAQVTSYREFGDNLGKVGESLKNESERMRVTPTGQQGEVIVEQQSAGQKDEAIVNKNLVDTDGSASSSQLNLHRESEQTGSETGSNGAPDTHDTQGEQRQLPPSRTEKVADFLEWTSNRLSQSTKGAFAELNDEIQKASEEAYQVSEAASTRMHIS